ncbi:MAG TPA: permease prefix domain 1-containing protein [Gaiellaceae bacterium]|nr:permease prefix domain 1-containing protein [Gaiellaceae bacterium]
MTDIERYLVDVAAQVRGAGSRRLRAELRGHVDDAIADHVASGRDATEAVQLALERLGPTDELVAAWNELARVRRVRARRRATVVAFGAVTASSLALVQHASGHAPTQRNLPAATVSPSCASATTAGPRIRPPGRCGDRPLRPPESPASTTNRN